MGLQDKLLKEYVRGCNDTWDLIDVALKDAPGIGPKTQQKILEAIRKQAAKEVESVDNLRPAERKRLYNTIDEVGFKGSMKK